jgi:peptide/nickel transport system substrate-binding protein
MLRSSRFLSLVSMLMLVIVVLAACGSPATTTEAPAVTSAPAEAVAPTEAAPPEPTEAAPTEAPVEPTEAAPAAETATEDSEPAATSEADTTDATTTAGSSAGTAKGTLTVAVTVFPNSLDLPATAEVNAGMVAGQLYDSLVFLNDEGEIVPALAESWTVSDDGTEYTFKLRQGVEFHNGESFTADSVVASWERGKAPEMKFGDRWAVAQAVTKVDDYTVTVKTEKANPLLLRLIASNWGMVPPKYIAEVGTEGFAAKPVGTGPFMFEEWVKEDRIVMKANPNYWQEGLPKLERLIFRPIPESSTRVAAIQTGEVDIAPRLSAEEAGSLEGKPNITVLRYPVDRVYYITFNNMTSGVDKPTMDPRVRLAMNYAVDRKAIIDSLLGGAGKEITGFITSANLGYDESIQPYPYDPDRARALLAEAGYADGFEMDFACPAGAYTSFEQVCESIVGYLGEVGITANLEQMESAKFWDLEAKKELPPLFGDSWSESSGEAYPRLFGALGGKEAAFSSWSDPKIDDYLTRISTTMDDQARGKLYAELQKYMYDEPPFIYLYSPETFEGVSTRVQDYKPRANEMKYLMEVSVAE